MHNKYPQRTNHWVQAQTVCPKQETPGGKLRWEDASRFDGSEIDDGILIKWIVIIYITPETNIPRAKAINPQELVWIIHLWDE